MTEAVIVSAVRTAVGRAFKGSLRATRPDDLAAKSPPPMSRMILKVTTAATRKVSPPARTFFAPDVPEGAD